MALQQFTPAQSIYLWLKMRFLAAALTRVMRAAVPIPAVAAASVLHFAAVGGSVVGVVRPL